MSDHDEFTDVQKVSHMGKNSVVQSFETRVQYLKFMVLKEVAKAAFDDTLAKSVLEIPERIIPGTKPTMRCCVYKERAIVAERIKLAMGGNPSNDNVIEVVKIACDECPEAGYEVTDSCRGCIAHHCESVCAKNAISFNDHQKAMIDKSKCVQCGRCSSVCPYGAIVNYRRPCEKACKAKAISMDEDKAAMISNDDCVACGACVYQCPFGAIVDKSFILDTVRLLRNAAAGGDKVVAVVAPSIAVQFKGVKVGQVAAAIKALGFYDVEEAALGADMVAVQEAHELAGKGVLTSSCCPAFVSYIHKKFPEMSSHVSETPSPMVMAAMSIKQRLPGAKVVFVGPCTAKKAEAVLPKVKPYIDNVITFEELQALFAAKDINIADMPDDPLSSASRYGRNFAASGGVAAAVRKALGECAGELDESFELRPVVCSGIEECRMVLLKASKGHAEGNFIEGMACVGGCVNGAAGLVHGERNRVVLEGHSEEVRGRRISDMAAEGYRGKASK